MKTPSAERLQRCLERNPVLIGIGSRWHADDAAGPTVISRLSEQVAAKCIDAGDAPERHLGEAVGCGADNILLLDAVDFGGAPGEIALFTPQDLPDRYATTHTSSLKLIMQYFEAETCADVFLLGIQPSSTDFGASMSVEVTAAVDALVELIEVKLGAQAIPCMSDQKGGQGHRWR